MVSIIYFFTALLCLKLCDAHTYALGDCPNVHPVQDLDMSKFLGVWHVIQRTSSEAVCLIYNITQGPNEHVYAVTETRKHPLLGLGTREGTFHYQGTISKLSEPGRMIVKFPISIGASNLVVFDTDYDDYAGLFSCRGLPLSHQRAASLLSRGGKMSKETMHKLREKLRSIGVSPDDLKDIDHTNCPSSYYPDIDIKSNFGKDELVEKLL